MNEEWVPVHQAAYEMSVAFDWELREIGGDSIVETFYAWVEDAFCGDIPPVWQDETRQAISRASLDAIIERLHPIYYPWSHW